MKIKFFFIKKILIGTFLKFTFCVYALTPEEYCTSSKKNKCVTDYGTLLGEYKNIKSFSNCRSECIKSEPNFVSAKDIKANEKIFSGIGWQCVEYARRWWMLQRGILFGSVDNADEIYSLNEATRLLDNKKIFLKKFSNSSSIPPHVGDLLIYSKQKNNPAFQYGHVAVIVGVNLKAGYIEVAEQNYDNKIWESPKKYSRRIAIELKNDKYNVYDIPYVQFVPGKENETDKNIILGWITPEF